MLAVPVLTEYGKKLFRYMPNYEDLKILIQKFSFLKKVIPQVFKFKYQNNLLMKLPM